MELKECEVCLERAVCICYKCMIYYCDSCFNLAHKKEIRQSHKKEKIDYYIPIDTKCPEHKLNVINLFCVDEKGNYYIYII